MILLCLYILHSGFHLARNPCSFTKGYLVYKSSSLVYLVLGLQAIQLTLEIREHSHFEVSQPQSTWRSIKYRLAFCSLIRATVPLVSVGSIHTRFLGILDMR
jgi:hypothetical protein